MMTTDSGTQPTKKVVTSHLGTALDASHREEGGSKAAGTLPDSVPGLDAALGSRAYTLRSLTRRLSNGRELWALSDQALVSGANFLTNLLLARCLGVSGFGVYALCWTLVLLMSGLQAAVITSPMMSVGPKQAPEERPAYFGAVTLHALAFAGCSALCLDVAALVGMRWFPSWGIAALALPLCMSTGAYLLQDFARRYFFTLRNSRSALLCDAFSYLPQLPFLWWLGWQHRLTVSRALWVIGITSLLSFFLSALLRQPMVFGQRSARKVAHRHWALVRWFVPSAILQWASQNLILVFAPIFYGAAAAGALRACQNVVAVAHIWFLGLENVVPTEASVRFHEQGTEGLLRYVRNVLRKWGALTFAFMLLVSLAPSVWLHLLYGRQYIGFGYVLRLYCLLYLVTFVGVPLRAGLQAIEYVSPTLWSYCVTTLFAAIAAEPLARHFGLVGVLVGLILAQVLFQAILATALILRTGHLRRLSVQSTSIPGVVL